MMHFSELYSSTRRLSFRKLLHLRDLSTCSKFPWTENKAFSNKAGGANTEDSGLSSYDAAGVSPRGTCTLQLITIFAVTLWPELPPGATISRWGYDLINFYRMWLGWPNITTWFGLLTYIGISNQGSVTFKLWILRLVLISGLCSVGFSVSFEGQIHRLHGIFSKSVIPWLSKDQDQDFLS